MHQPGRGVGKILLPVVRAGLGSRDTRLKCSGQSDGSFPTSHYNVHISPCMAVLTPRIIRRRLGFLLFMDRNM